MWRLILLLVLAIGCQGKLSDSGRGEVVTGTQGWGHIFSIIPVPRTRAERNVTGDHKHDPYIVGGVDTPSNEALYQLSLETDHYANCGASVISTRWALTAAHCVFATDPQDIQLRSGSRFLERGGHRHQVTQIIYSNEFTSKLMDYDVAVLKVAPDDLFPQEYIIKLSKQRPVVGTLATVSGWGRLSEDGQASDCLQWVQVPIVDQARCTALNFDVDITITPRMLCAGYPHGGKDACKGDSGGPLVVGEYQVGIISQGYGCAQPQGGVYTDVAQVRQWITKQTGVE